MQSTTLGLVSRWLLKKTPKFQIFWLLNNSLKLRNFSNVVKKMQNLVTYLYFQCNRLFDLPVSSSCINLNNPEDNKF